MGFCSRCGREASGWTIDLTTGVCVDCRAEEKEAGRRAEREAVERVRAAAEEKRRTEAEAVHGCCPQRGVPFVPVKLLGRTGAADAEVAYYADTDAQPSAFLEQFPEAGTVRAALCPSCRRIDLRGLPVRGTPA